MIRIDRPDLILEHGRSHSSNAQRDENGEWRVHIKRRNALSTATYPFNPLDAIGWKGDLAPVRINWRAVS